MDKEDWFERLAEEVDPEDEHEGLAELSEDRDDEEREFWERVEEAAEFEVPVAWTPEQYKRWEDAN